MNEERDELENTENYDDNNTSNKSSLTSASLGLLIKKLPLKVKLIIAAVVIGLSLFLLLILCGAAYISMGKFTGDKTSVDIGYTQVGDNSSFWWPIGSKETSSKNGVLFASGQPELLNNPNDNQDYGMRNIGSGPKMHRGVDFGSGGRIDQVNIIAPKAGVVIEVNTSCKDNNNYLDSCGGYRGNYVLIDHKDGTLSRSQHMAYGSVTLSVGDTVQQGQVIGKIGASGSCQGAHLHFEIYLGDKSNDVDPMNYISSTNPRPVSNGILSSGLSEKGLKMLQAYEGTGPVSGDNYLAYKDAVGVLTIGYGVTIQYNKSRFSARGIDPNSIGVGTAIPKKIVDDIKQEIIRDMLTSIDNTLSSNGITLQQHQREALLIRMYNTGNIQNFPSNYKQYGDTEALYNNYMSKPVTGKGGKYLSGLARRRAEEWNLFHNGIYTG